MQIFSERERLVLEAAPRDDDDDDDDEKGKRRGLCRVRYMRQFDESEKRSGRSYNAIEKDGLTLHRKRT